MVAHGGGLMPEDWVPCKRVGRWVSFLRLAFLLGGLIPVEVISRVDGLLGGH
jgi:hypothetical protein